MMPLNAITLNKLRIHSDLAVQIKISKLTFGEKKEIIRHDLRIKIIT